MGKDGKEGRRGLFQDSLQHLIRSCHYNSLHLNAQCTTEVIFTVIYYDIKIYIKLMK